MFMICLIKLFVCISIFSFKCTISRRSSYVEWARTHFQNSFDKACNKYPWVEDYINRKSIHKDRFAIFVFHNGSRNNYVGGLGDRLSGLVTAFAFALRTNRTFLIESDDKGFIEAFRPYHTDSAASGAKDTWGDWSWSGWNHSLIQRQDKGSYRQIMCLNHKTKAHSFCKLDADVEEAVLHITINRAFLCRWNEMVDLPAHGELLRLGITQGSDLFEAAGCMLRLALWPTAKLWRTVERQIGSELSQKALGGSTLSAVSSVAQVGLHFRCGDHALGLSEKLLKRKYVAPAECVQKANVFWTGTHPLGYSSLDSPVHAGRCAKKLIHAIRLQQQFRRSNSNMSPPSSTQILGYITSDSAASAHQMNLTMAWPHTLVDRTRCHIDYQANESCTMSTAAAWLTLANSDHIVLQSFAAHPLKTVSAFSRYALVYSLRPDVVRFATECVAVNKTEMSRTGQGNWACAKGGDK